MNRWRLPPRWRYLEGTVGVFFPVNVRRAGVYPPRLHCTLQRYLEVRSFGMMLPPLPSVSEISTSYKGNES